MFPSAYPIIDQFDEALENFHRYYYGHEVKDEQNLEQRDCESSRLVESLAFWLLHHEQFCAAMAECHLKVARLADEAWGHSQTLHSQVTEVFIWDRTQSANAWKCTKGGGVALALTLTLTLNYINKTFNYSTSYPCPSCQCYSVLISCSPIFCLLCSFTRRNLCCTSNSTMKQQQKLHWNPVSWFTYGNWKCMSVDSLTNSVLAIVFTIECGVNDKTWRPSPISFKHLSLRCVKLDSHLTTPIGVTISKASIVCPNSLLI